MSRNRNPAEAALMEKLEETDSNILDVNVRGPKPVYTVTIEGKDVAPDVLDACREFGYERILETKQVKFTPEIGTATTIMFYY